MSSLLPKPFSVCEGPCESVRRGCTSPDLHPQAPSQRLAAATVASAVGMGSLPPARRRSYAARRTLAAASIGRRKITHPGKAILAGYLPSFLHTLHSLISVCRPLKAVPAELGHSASSSDATAAARVSIYPLFTHLF